MKLKNIIQTRYNNDLDNISKYDNFSEYIEYANPNAISNISGVNFCINKTVNVSVSFKITENRGGKSAIFKYNGYTAKASSYFYIIGLTNNFVGVGYVAAYENDWICSYSPLEIGEYIICGLYYIE